MSPTWKESHGHLPATIDPIQLAERGARLTGTLPLKGMSRLAQNCLDDSGEVFIDLAFERGEGEKVLLMHGTLHVTLHVKCQRCLEAMDLALEASPWFILARSEKRQDMLGDEPDVLVALPMVPMHELNQCPARDYVSAGTDSGSKQVEEEGKSPFSVLSRLKKTR